MVSKTKVEDVVKYFNEFGKEKTVKDFSITEETLSRYLRKFRSFNSSRQNLLDRINDRFTDEELRIIAKGGSATPTPFSPSLINFSGDVFKFGILSDTHFGSKFTYDNLIFKIYEEMDKQGCAFIAHPGDVTEGMMARPNHIYELTDVGFTAQRDKAIKMMSHWTKGWKVISGNHDESYNIKLGAGVSIVSEICKEVPNASYIGSGSGRIEINGVKIELFHGADGGASYALSYRLQKTIESFASRKKPHIVITGHAHKAFYLPMYRNVQGIEAGCFQSQTDFMAQKRSAAHTGFWIVTMSAKDGSLLWFEPRWYPLYI